MKEQLNEAIRFANSHGLSVVRSHSFDGRIWVDVVNGSQTLYSKLYSKSNASAQASFIKRSTESHVAKLRASGNWVSPHRRVMYKASGETVSTHVEGLMGTLDGYTWFLHGSEGYIWMPGYMEWVACAVTLSDFTHMDRVCRAWVDKRKMYHC